jgi:hypothetical protein
LSLFYDDLDDNMEDPEFAYEFGRTERELEILQWVEQNRSAIELEPGEVIYRDHFNSQSLIAFIKGENK